MTGTQLAVDPATGEIMDDKMLRELYTETSISGTQLIGDRLSLGKRVRVTLTAQVVAIGKALDKDGNKISTQKLKVESVEEVEKGAL